MKDFASNDDVVFGDMNLQNGCCRKGPNGGDLGAGKGGWPTVRIFNKETGYDGGAYTKKTTEAMCTELGPGKPYLKQLVEEYGSTTLEADASKEEL